LGLKQILLLNADDSKLDKISLNLINKERKVNERFYNIKLKDQIKNKLILKSMDNNISITKINNLKPVHSKPQHDRANKNNNSYLNNSLDDYNAELLTKKFDFFDIGYILIYSALGGMEIIKFSEYVCTHESNDQKDSSFQSGCCCLYHCVEKTEKKLNTKLKLTNFINNTRFTQEFIDFICLCTSFDLLERNVTFSKLKNHTWLNMKEDIVPNIFEFSDLYVTYPNKKKNLYEKNVDNLIDVISRTFPASSSYFQDNNFQNSSAILNKENKDLVELSIDIGVDVDTLINKLKPLFDLNLQNIN